MTIHRLPFDAKLIEEVTEILKMPWRGEGLPSVTFKALLHFLRPARKGITAEVGKEIIKQQGEACAVCGKERASKATTKYLHIIEWRCLTSTGTNVHTPTRACADTS